eukprot:244553-Prorocentrum_minimum.AAC.1
MCAFSCANNGKGALNTQETLPLFSLCVQGPTSVTPPHAGVRCLGPPWNDPQAPPRAERAADVTESDGGCDAASEAAGSGTESDRNVPERDADVTESDKDATESDSGSDTSPTRHEGVPWNWVGEGRSRFRSDGRRTKKHPRSLNSPNSPLDRGPDAKRGREAGRGCAGRGADGVRRGGGGGAEGVRTGHGWEGGWGAKGVRRRCGRGGKGVPKAGVRGGWDGASVGEPGGDEAGALNVSSELVTPREGARGSESSAGAPDSVPLPLPLLRAGQGGLEME